ncbi:unnamed protein product [Prorocentrum cordatum]|uniref:Uncharacterized protein n=1 Tax=Prorocentrum cordatum TaxID=2364126 RepID=A0ABN9SKQ5_9DINO|nr:unnamed protein product [Polarella glacialis]
MLCASPENFFGWASVRAASSFFASSLFLPRRRKARGPLNHLARARLRPKQDCEDRWPMAMCVEHSSHVFWSSTALAPSSAAKARLSTSPAGSPLMALLLKSSGMVPNEAATSSRHGYGVTGVAGGPGALAIPEGDQRENWHRQHHPMGDRPHTQSKHWSHMESGPSRAPSAASVHEDAAELMNDDFDVNGGQLIEAGGLRVAGIWTQGGAGTSDGEARALDHSSRPLSDGRLEAALDDLSLWGGPGPAGQGPHEAPRSSQAGGAAGGAGPALAQARAERGDAIAEEVASELAEAQSMRCQALLVTDEAVSMAAAVEEPRPPRARGRPGGSPAQRTRGGGAAARRGRPGVRGPQAGDRNLSGQPRLSKKRSMSWFWMEGNTAAKSNNMACTQELLALVRLAQQ